MIHGLFGLAHIGLSHFHAMCTQQNLSYAIISPSGSDKRMLGDTVEPFPIVILGVVNFLKIQSRFKKPVCVFIVDNPVQLESVGATILSATKISTYHYKFHPVKPTDLRLAIDSCGKEPIEIKIRKTRVVSDLLKAASAESILSPLQTAFYQIKSLDIRTKIQDGVFDFLAGKGSQDLLSKLVNKKVSDEKIAGTINGLMEEKRFRKLRKASVLVLAKKLPFDKASTKFSVPLYDLKYVCKKMAAKKNIVLPG